MPFEYTFLGGVLLGLASSLHCAGMCGPISASMLFMIAPNGTKAEKAKVMAFTQAGRIVSYVLAGAALGLVGSSFYGVFDRDIAYRVLQWAAAASLGWIGLSIAGLVPSIAGIDRIMVPLTRRLATVRSTLAPALGEQSFLAGLLWGLVPCGMVYAALFNALLTGSVGGGAFVMIGFGLGTVPSVSAAALGIVSLPRMFKGQHGRVLVGLAISALGTLSLALSVPGGPLCIT